MASYLTGEVEAITGIKQSVLRYWEELIPLITPSKDGFGRRTYSSRDVQIILRLKHLILKQKFSIEDAYKQVLAENSNLQNASLVANLNATKDNLLALYRLVHVTKDTKHEKKQ